MGEDRGVGKVNSESDFNEISFEKTKQNTERLLVARVMSPLMYPKISLSADI